MIYETVYVGVTAIAILEFKVQLWPVSNQEGLGAIPKLIAVHRNAHVVDVTQMEHEQRLEYLDTVGVSVATYNNALYVAEQEARKRVTMITRQ